MESNPTPAAEISAPETPTTLSPQRIAANRANALLSTGPRTPDGKARSAQNALTHGLRARLDPASLVPLTEQSEYAPFVQDFHDHLNPQSPLEEILVERIALLGWKLRRHAQAEARLLDLTNQRDREATEAANRDKQDQYDQKLAYNHLYRIKAPVTPPTINPLPDSQHPANLIARFAQSPDQQNPLLSLQRYETATERAFYKALTQYRFLQSTSTTSNSSDLHHHFHYHRHNEPLPPDSNCAKFPNEATATVPTLPILQEIPPPDRC